MHFSYNIRAEVTWRGPLNRGLVLKREENVRTITGKTPDCHGVSNYDPTLITAEPCIIDLRALTDVQTIREHLEPYKDFKFEFCRFAYIKKLHKTNDSKYNSIGTRKKKT